MCSLNVEISHVIKEVLWIYGQPDLCWSFQKKKVSGDFGLQKPGKYTAKPADEISFPAWLYGTALYICRKTSRWRTNWQ